MNQGIPMQNQPMQNQQMQTQQALLQQQMLMQQQEAAMQANPQNPFAPAPPGGWPMGGSNQQYQQPNQQYQQPQYAYAQPATNPHANASAPQFGVTPQQYYQQNQSPNPNS